MKNIVGLTGPTGSGKSTFSVLAEQKGFTVIDCDEISRLVTKKDSLCLEKLAEEFGEDILNDGVLDRKLLAKRAFVQKERKEKLEEIIFPFILSVVMEKINNADSDNILLDAPTLFESGIDEMCGTVVATLCPLDVRKKRIIERDNLSDQQAEIRLSAGKPDDFYKERADFILDSNKTEAEYKKVCSELLDKLLEE